MGSTFSTSQNITQTWLDTHLGPYRFTGENTTITFVEASVLITTSAQYFILQAPNILVDGRNHGVVISAVADYPGLIQNGRIDSDGQDNAFIRDLHIVVVAMSTLAEGGGWFAQAGFGRGVTGGIILNCWTDGSANNTYCGNIVGRSANQLTIQQCASSNTIGANGGGIVGTGANACNIRCCYSLGSIGTSSGGILGALSTACSAIQCYSRGVIGDGAGGIIGASSTSFTVNNCYSTGTLTTITSGGIVGQSPNGAFTILSYSTGASGFNTGGIVSGYATDTISVAGIQAANCYSNANNGSSGWSDVQALAVLHPNSAWASLIPNTPFVLPCFAQQLYDPDSHSQDTKTAYHSGNGLFPGDYFIYSITTSGGSPTGAISIRPDVGTLFFPDTLDFDTYVVTVFQQTSVEFAYNFNTFTFNLFEPTPPPPPSPTVLPCRWSPLGYFGFYRTSGACPSGTDQLPHSTTTTCQCCWTGEQNKCNK